MAESLYTIHIYVEGEHKRNEYCNHPNELQEKIYEIGIRWCTRPREWGLTPEGWTDYTKLIPRPRIEVAVFDTKQEMWCDGAGTPRQRGVFKLPLTNRVNVGNLGIE